MPPSSADEPWSQVEGTEGDDRTPIVAGGSEEVVGEVGLAKQPPTSSGLVIQISGIAFDEAWITLKSSGSGTIRPDEAARRICHLAMEGERDPMRLHDRAVGELIPATMWRELS